MLQRKRVRHATCILRSKASESACMSSMAHSPLGIQDSGLRTEDSGLGTRDPGARTQDAGPRLFIHINFISGVRPCEIDGQRTQDRGPYHRQSAILDLVASCTCRTSLVCLLVFRSLLSLRPPFFLLRRPTTTHFSLANGSLLTVLHLGGVLKTQVLP